MTSNVQKIHTLLKGIETGDPQAALVVNEDVYIQHNPHTKEGNQGLAELFKELAKSDPKVTMVRGFEDGDYVFAHMEYHFSSVKVAFEVFRFEDGYAVEHWDNIQPKLGPNPSDRSMLDGDAEAIDQHKTADNKQLITGFVTDVLIKNELPSLSRYFHQDELIQHNPFMADGTTSFLDTLKRNQTFALRYQKLHRILGEGNFVLSVSEGQVNGEHSAIYDLWRLENGKITEHWDTIEAIPPQAIWKNNNGKF